MAGYFIHPAPAPFGCPESDMLTKVEWANYKTNLPSFPADASNLTTSRSESISDTDAITTASGGGSLTAQFYIVGCPRTVNVAIEATISFTSTAAQNISLLAEGTVADDVAFLLSLSDPQSGLVYSGTATITGNVDIDYDGACPLLITAAVGITYGNNAATINATYSLSITITP